MLASASEEIFTSAFLFSKLRGLITTLIGAPIRSESLNLTPALFFLSSSKTSNPFSFKVEYNLSLSTFTSSFLV